MRSSRGCGKRTGFQEEREIFKKGRGLLREAPATRFAFIASEKARHSVTTLCRCLDVTRSGFYAWLERGLSPRARRDLVLRTKLHALHRDQDGESAPSELQPLRSLGVQSIQLRGLSLNNAGSHGNEFWFGSWFTYRAGGELRPGPVTDVVLKVK